MVRRYDEYKVGRDNAEYAAQKQSTGEKWAYGATKFAGNVALGIIGNTAGVINGIGKWAEEGSFRASYDNQFNNYLDDLNEKLSYKLPNHYKKAEQEMGFFDQMGTANFWADKVLGGAAFTVSAIASEAIWGWATGGAGTASVTARLGMQAERLFGAEAGIAKTLKAMSRAKSTVAEPVAATFTNAMLPVGLATKMGKAGELLNTARYMYTSAGFESGMEARTYIREMKDSFQSDFEAKNNRPPTEEEIKEFNEDLTNSANALYGFNMAIVGSSNLMTIGRLADIKNPLSGTSKWANSKLFGIGLEEVEGKMIAKTATKLQTAAKYAWGIGESPLMEGVFEEGMQSVGKNTAKYWIQSKYDPKYSKNTLDISTAFTQGLSDTYGTKKGMEEVGIGMLIGLITGTGTNLYKYGSLKGEVKEAEKSNKNLENFYNSYYSPNKVAETLAYSNRVQASNVGADAAQKKGDFVGGELNRQSAIIAQLSQAHNLDYLDETVKQTEIAIKNIGNDLLMKEYGVDEQGANDIKDKLIEEHKSTAKIYEKYRNFSEYYIGKSLSKEEQEKAGTLGVRDIKDAIAYELTLGEKVHGFSQDLLTAIKEETGRTVLGTDMSGALSIEDILLKAGKETRKEAQGKEKQIINLDRQREALEREYKEVEKTMFNTVEPEDRKKFLNKTDSIRNQIKDIEGQIENLTKDYSLLIKTANMKNPFGKNVDDILISSQSVKNRIRTLNQIKELAGELGKTDPQKGLKLQKLLDEYGKSITAFTRYADLSRQLSDPKLGLKGKRNIITEIRSDKTPTDITVEFLEGLKKSMGEDAVIDQAANAIEGQGIVQEILDKKEKPVAPEDGDTIEAPTAEEIQSDKDKKIKAITEEYDAKIDELYKVKGDNVEVEQKPETKSPKDIDIERRNLEREKEDAIDEVRREGTEKVKQVSIRDYIRDLIKNSPYLFEYYGEDTPVMMTEQEMDEFQDLARRAIEDPKIDNKTISFKSPYTWNRLTPTTRPSLSRAEIKRLQELNEKLANWRLLEVYGSSEGVSITDMILQDILTKRTVEPVDTTQTVDNDFHKVNQEREPKVDENGKEVRRSEILQNIEKVVARKAKDGFYISHFTLQGLVERLETLQDEIIYTEVDEKGKVIPNSDKKILVEDIINNSKVNARFLLTFENGSTATVRITRGGQIVLKNAEAEKVLEDARLKFIQGGELNTSNYGDIYDLESGEGHKLDSDFRDVLDYSPQEIYNTKPGSVIKFEVDIEDSYNQEIIQAFREVEAEFENDTKEYEDAANYLRDQIKINTLDKAGNRVGMLKANYNIKGDNAAFLLIRDKAFERALDPKDQTKIRLDVESSVNFIFLGSANYTLEEGKVKLFEPVTDKIVDYGYYDKGKLILKGGKTETTIKTHFLAKLKNRSNLPVIVFKQGEYLVAFPVSLKTKSDIKLGNEFLDNIKPGYNMGKVAIELNNLLEQHHLSPSKYQLYYAGAESETLFNEQGNNSEDFNKAITDLNKIPQVADVRDWMEPEFKKEDLAKDILIPFDLNNNPLSSPKIVLNLDSDSVVIYKNADEETSQADAQDEAGKIIAEIVDENLQNNEESNTFAEPKKEAAKKAAKNVAKTDKQVEDIDNTSQETKDTSEDVVGKHNAEADADIAASSKKTREDLNNNTPTFC
jgi:hypothetical protein